MLEFLKQGCTVFAGVRSLDALNDTKHPQLRPVKLDVNSASDIEQCINSIKQEFGQLDMLINNAGFAAMGPLTELSQQKLQQQFNTNCFAPILLTQAALPLLKVSKRAKVVNIGSVSGIMSTPFAGAYCASKAALHALSDALRLELTPFNIDVITVQPGAIQSSFGDNSLSSLAGLVADDSDYAKVKSHIEARATASQNNPTKAEDLARELVAQLFNQPKAIIRLGRGSRLLPWTQRWLPLSIRDGLLLRKFGLQG